MKGGTQIHGHPITLSFRREAQRLEAVIGHLASGGLIACGYSPEGQIELPILLKEPA